MTRWTFTGCATRCACRSSSERISRSACADIHQTNSAPAAKMARSRIAVSRGFFIS
ncbi:MAG: hypothetical protein WCR46_16895 [Deltaproteobacteria bacterium]